MQPKQLVAVAVAVLGGLLGPHAPAATVAGVSPQGEVAQVRQVVVKFSESVVAFGDPRLADPFVVQCQGPVPSGQGRWISDRAWTYDFDEAPGPGLKCRVRLKAGWKPSAANASALTGATDFTFQTGGPAIVQTRPWPGSEIAEDQHFILQLSGPALEASVADKAWCEVDGLGERLPLKLVVGAAREAALKSQRIDKRLHARTLVAGCGRPLPNDTAVRLVWGAGIAAQGNPAVMTRGEQRERFRVRKPFVAEFGCERERAGAPCLPIRPMSLGFSAPIARALAQQVRLKSTAGTSFAPVNDRGDPSTAVTSLTFPVPLPENARFTVELPADLKDDAGRALANAASFPLAVATGEAPPLAKFAAAPFGVIEYETDAKGQTAQALLPITLRHVQPDLRDGAPAPSPAASSAAPPPAPRGSVRIKRLASDAEILDGYAKLKRWHESELTAKEAGRPEREWFTQRIEQDARGRNRVVREERRIATRELPLLAGDAGARTLDLPPLRGGDPRPFEVIGLPIAEPGFHVVEVASVRLGAALLDKPAPLYVRTGALATNLGVHFKHGRQSSVVWVTSLDRGKPVEGAEVVVNDCRGKPMWTGRTDAQGLARIDQPLDDGLDGSSGRACAVPEGLFITARKPLAARPSVIDTAFVFSSWQKGIESWRFDVATSRDPQPDLRAHTVFDRTLLRAGETVSMKHFIRAETAKGLLPLAPQELPTRLRLVHQGSGEETVLPLAWAGQRHALSSWNIPAAAKLGVYEVVLERDAPKDAATSANEAGQGPRTRFPAGDFRVEEFRVPLLDVKLVGPKEVPIAPASLPIALQMNHQSGGGVAAAPVRISALLKPRAPNFPGREDFRFEPPRDPKVVAGEESEPTNEAAGRLVVDKLAAKTDAKGAASLTLDKLPAIERPSELLAEATFNDPNGEVQTVATRIGLWPAAVVVGVRAGSWVSQHGKTRFQVIALDTAGRVLAGQALAVRARLSETLSTRKRMVGGFYAYDNRTELRELGTVCSGTSDAQGLLNCEASLDTAGQVELIASAKDAQGRTAQAATSVWVTRAGELWFAQDNDDRIDLLPERRSYQPGETARLQLRMPYREATVLVGVEREGVLATRVVTLRGDDPTIELKIEPGWGPNVYVTALALRGRVREVHWTSFFQWGWKQPFAWWRAWRDEGPGYQAPTAMADLSKPSFKVGMAALQVGMAEHALQVAVGSDKPAYQVRQKAVARVKVSHAGKPAAGAEIAFAAVDEGLLALRDNASWDLLDAMFRSRPWGVETSTAHNEIVGRRHYGRKAVAAGGGGGRGATRELFDTLLLWKGRVALDANGEATIEVPLNDSLTSFRLVAIADDAGPDGTPRFGSGSTTIRVTQDLQVLAGLPPLVREGDRYTALVTLRNTTAREMRVKATLAGTALLDGLGDAASARALAATAASGDPRIERRPVAPAAQEVRLGPGAAQELSWPIEVPPGAFSIGWELSAEELDRAANEAARDRVKLTQLVTPAVPVRVLQATLARLDGRYTLPVAPPADALPLAAAGEGGAKRGGLTLGLQPKLSGALPGLRRYFETYPFACLEQKASKAVGLRDAPMWQTVAETLATYLDADGLAGYFPPTAADAARGSDRLTAYLLAATHEAGFALPEPAKTRMLDGLAAFVEGRIERRFWAPAFAASRDVDVRKLAAIEALARHGRAQARQLGSIDLAPDTWPTAAVIDWLSILKRVQGLPRQAERLAEAQQILRARMTLGGTTLKFSNEDDDFWWWLMDSADANAAKLILAVLDDPAWKDELPQMVVGSLARQKRGAWLTTTANLWGSLALDKFSAKFESQPIAGKTVASFGNATQGFDWSAQTSPASSSARLVLPWPAGANGVLNAEQQGSGTPWLTVQSTAAIPLKAPLRAGYGIKRTVSAVTQKLPGRWSRGDVMRVRLEIDAQADMSWVVVSDPVPGGATLLGSGLGRDSAIAVGGEQREGSAWLAHQERSFEAWRGYYEFLPRGRHVVEYTLRLNNPGRFGLPPTRVEAMYAPETFGEVPNGSVDVLP
ncbi:MAG TPA: MG2 domain-containing protein [Methylibium sp.]|uniref:alpha-2-macroglobulin family protein n=1 Tax=Methylibium sp. TaxID=2067992 RepID=UPI002DB707FC|nr:MG2 domain-containing protein [Methylibium sp.]HEU4457954.1 MG2 domain-containing protein [Methylibium sp.]